MIQDLLLRSRKSFALLISGYLVSEDEKLGATISKAIDSSLENFVKEKSNFVFSTPAPESILPKSGNFLDFEPLEFARQIILHEQDLYRNIQSDEFLSLSWNANPQKSPNIVKMKNWSNGFSQWIQTFILSEKKLEKRAKILKKIVDILVELYNLKNFNGSQEVLISLNATPINRLYQTWAQFRKKNPKLAKEFETIQGDLSLRVSSEKYKEFESINAPVLPYLGAYLSDLTQAEEMHNFIKPQGEEIEFINIAKITRISKIISDFKAYKRQPYNFIVVQMIYDFLTKGLVSLDEDGLLEKSKELEEGRLDTLPGRKDSKRISLIFKKKKN